jgi:hypothetical protein
LPSSAAWRFGRSYGSPLALSRPARAKASACSRACSLVRISARSRRRGRIVEIEEFGFPAVREASLVAAGLRHGFVPDDARHHSIIAHDPPARVPAARRSHIPSDFMMTARLSSWCASAVQLREIFISTADRRAEFPGLAPRILCSTSKALHCSTEGILSLPPGLRWPSPV